MEIKTVHYSALINLGNYSNERIGFAAHVSEGETVDSVVEALRQKVKENGGTNADEIYNQQAKGQRELKELEQKIRKATEEWNSVSEFLRTQGIKPDAPSMPQFKNLLPEVKEEHSEIVDCEIEDDDDDY